MVRFYRKENNWKLLKGKGKLEINSLCLRKGNSFLSTWMGKSDKIVLKRI